MVGLLAGRFIGMVGLLVEKLICMVGSLARRVHWQDGFIGMVGPLAWKAHWQDGFIGMVGPLASRLICMVGSLAWKACVLVDGGYIGFGLPLIRSSICLRMRGIRNTSVERSFCPCKQ